MEQTPVMRQYRELKALHPDAILFFQLGDFYETFFDDAEVVARDLEIVLTSRDGVPMAGVPVRKADLYVQRLLRKGHKVALGPQLERPGQGKRLLKRGVVRVLTPGTAIEEGALDAGTDVLLAAVWPDGEHIGMAWVEAASGEFWGEEVALADLGHLVARLPVAEWIFPEGWHPPIELSGLSTERPRRDFSRESLASRFPDALRNAPRAAAAAGALLSYLATTVGTLGHLRPPTMGEKRETLVLDAFTHRSLELLAPLRAEGTRTLFSTLDRTKTAMGRRLLRRWILAPLAQRERIEERHDAVEVLVDSGLGDTVDRTLSGCCDLPRLLGRAVTGGLSPADLIALARTLDAALEIARRLADLPTPVPKRLAVVARMIGAVPVQLAHDVRRAIAAPPPPTLDQGSVIRSGYDSTLDALRLKEGGLRTQIAALEGVERDRTGIPSLKVGYSRVFGHYFEVTRSQLDKVPQDWRRRQSLTSGERFTSTELATLADRLVEVEEEIADLERELFVALCHLVEGALGPLGLLGDALAEFDALRSLAEVAHRKRYVRPQFTDQSVVCIRNGRHPMVEEVTQFVPNDLELGEGTRLAVVTGPNMAGKSVFLRQTALIALMAQMGSYVPAETAELPVFDRIYTRVGASDALTGGLSTFMAEMVEAGEILTSATPRSLVVLDELGRGTSTHDGMALARAIACHLAERVGCKTLFATHYRELARLVDEADGVVNLHAAAREWKGQLVFLYRILPGVAERSYGVHVARLAKLPEEVLADAQDALNAIERTAPTGGVRRGEQLPLFGGAHPVLDQLRMLDLDRMTPLEALAVLHRLREHLA